jgi:hypothetical protein
MSSPFEFEDATPQGNEHLSQYFDKAFQNTRAQLEGAINANHEELVFLLTRDRKFYSKEWTRLKLWLKSKRPTLPGTFADAFMQTVFFGFGVPVFTFALFKTYEFDFALPFLKSIFFPVCASLVTYFVTAAFFAWKAWRTEHEKYGFALAFLEAIPKNFLNRGFAATERAVYLVEADNEGVKWEVKRVPWSEISATIYLKEGENEEMRLLDNKGKFIAGLFSPHDHGGANMQNVIDAFRTKIAEQAIGFEAVTR